MRTLSKIALCFACTTFVQAQSVVANKTLAGGGNDQPISIAVDPQGNIYVAGTTTSSDFPVTAGAFKTTVNVPPLRISADAGKTFATLTIPRVSRVGALAMTPDGKVTYAATDHGVFRTSDGGKTWTGGNLNNVTTSALAVDPTNPNTVYAGTNLGAFKSTDGGATWGGISNGLNVTGSITPLAIVIDPFQPSTMYINFVGPGGLYRSTDAGNSWQAIGPPTPNQSTNGFYTYAFALDPKQEGVIYAGGGMGFVKSTDSGASWTFLTSEVGTESQYGLAIDPSNPSTLYVVNPGGALEKSIDGGRTFTFIGPADVQYLEAVAIDPMNPSRVYTASQGEVYASSDAGATWSPIAAAAGPVLLIGPNTLLVGSQAGSQIFLTKLNPLLTQIQYSTFLPGSALFRLPLAVDIGGNAYIAYNIAHAAGSAAGGGQPAMPFIEPDASVIKISPDGTRAIYDKRVGDGTVYGLALDPQAEAYLIGVTTDSNFPTTPGAYQTSPPGPCVNGTGGPLTPSGLPMYVVKLSNDGSTIDYSTFLKGTCGGYPWAVAVDVAGDAYVAGETYSPDFPTTSDAIAKTFPGTYSSGFLVKLNPSGSGVTYSTLFGGGLFTSARAMTLDANGNVYLGGATTALPATPGAVNRVPSDYLCAVINPGPGMPPYNHQDAFIMKLKPGTCNPLLVAKVGSYCLDEANSIALDDAGDIWIAGDTSPAASNFPTMALTTGLGSGSGFVSEFSPDGTQLLFSMQTALGALTAGSNGNIDFAGATVDPNKVAYFFSGLVAAIAPRSTPAVVVDSVSNYETQTTQIVRGPLTVAPGQLIRIMGRGLGPATTVGDKLNAAGAIDSTLGGVTVTFDGIAAPLVSVQANEIDLVTPFELTGQHTSIMQVTYNGQQSNKVQLAVVARQVNVLEVLNADGTLNSATNPAKAGTVIALYVTGVGQTNPPGINGQVNAAPFAPPAVPLDARVAIGNNPTSFQFIGAAPGLIAGIMQLNVLVPTGTQSGQQFLYSSDFDAPIYISQ